MNAVEPLSSDAWLLPLRPRGRRYHGQLFDATSRHSARLVPPDGGGPPISPESTHAVVDYFYHEGGYHRARIPLDSVVNVFAQAFNFSKPRTRSGDNGPELICDERGVPLRRVSCLNHVQTRFQLAEDQPVELYSLGQPINGSPCAQVNDLVYSIEAVGPIGVRFNLRDGMLGNLINAHRVLSTQEMVFERIVVENMYVMESPALPLDEAKRRAALIASLRRSDRAGIEETYYLYRMCATNNCTATPLIEIDKIADYTFFQRMATNLYRFPFRPRFYLRVRGLDSDPKVTKLVRDEFAQYVSDSQTIRRKRQYVRARTQQLRAARGRA